MNIFIYFVCVCVCVCVKFLAVCHGMDETLMMEEEISGGRRGGERGG